MSAKMMGQVWELVLTPARQSVLLALADHADHNGADVKPGVPLIAWKTGYSERQVQRIMRELEDDGLLVKVAQPPGRPTVYRIDLSKGTRKPAYVPKPKPGRRGDRVTPPTPDISSPHDGDNLTPQGGDILTGDRLSGVTSDGKDGARGGDMASADLSRIRQKEEPSVEEPKEKAAIAMAVVGSNGTSTAPDSVEENILRLWHENIAVITCSRDRALVAGLVERYGAEPVEYGIREAVHHNRRKPGYVEAVAKRAAADPLFHLPTNTWTPPEIRGEKYEQPY